MIDQIAGMGYRPDVTDFRDQAYTPSSGPVPPMRDLTAGMPPIWQQYALNGCIGHGVNRVVEFVFRANGQIDFTPSRLLTYYLARDLEGTVNLDCGAQIRNGIKAVAMTGVVPEEEWPYEIGRFAQRPPQSVYDDAAKHLALIYYRLESDLDQIRACINEGYPIVFGMTMHESIRSPETAKTGIVPMPTADESVIGGHCVASGKYDDQFQCRESEGAIIFENSWSEEWGMGGRGALPYAMLDLVSDVWSIRAME